MYILRYIFFLSIAVLGSVENSEVSKCGSTLRVLNCDINDPPQFSRRHLNKLKTEYKQGTLCEIVKFYFHWDIIVESGKTLSFDYYKHYGTFHLEPYMVPGGNHSFMVFVKEEYTNNEFYSLSEAGAFVITHENAIPILKGGAEVTVESGKSFSIDGSDSINLENSKNEKGKLSYKWNCSINDLPDSKKNFCDSDLGNAPILRVPAIYAVEGVKYIFFFGVKNSQPHWFETSQEVIIQSNVAVLEIKCLKNCPLLVLVTNIKEPTIFEVVCKNKIINNNSYKWTINSDNINYDTNTKLLENGKVFHINENVLESNRTYTIRVHLDGDLKGEAAFNIQTHSPPKIDSCRINPTTGIALKTPFSLHCSYQGVNMFEIYSVVTNSDTDTEETLLVKDAKLEDIHFILPPKSLVKVKIIDEFEYSDYKLVDVTVEDFLDTNQPHEQLVKEMESTYFDEDSKYSLKRFLKNKEYDSVLQALNVFTKQVGDLSQNKIEEYKKEIFHTLDKIPLDSEYRTKQVSEIATALASKSKMHQDPAIAQKATELCKKAAKKSLEFIKKERFKESLTNEIEEDAKLFTECSQVGAIAHLKVIEVPEVTKLTTQYPLIDVTVIEENYPDYVDDENASKAMHKLEAYNKNVVDLCFLNAESLLNIISPYENERYIKTEYFNITASKKYGKNIKSSNIESQNVILKLSEDFLRYKNDEVDTLLCTTSHNPFWWTHNPRVSPPIIILGFRLNNRRVSKFKKPFYIEFDASIIRPHLISRSCEFPKKLNTSAELDSEFESLIMYRIEVYRRQSYCIKFLGLESRAIKIFVTKFRKPSLREFISKSVVINNTNNEWFVENNENYDSWHYLSIFPTEDFKKDKFSFQFQVFTRGCFTWNFKTRKWRYSCIAELNSLQDGIICQCFSSSVLIAKVRNNNVKEELTIYVKHKLHFQASYVIFLSILTVWVVYCFLLLYFSINNRKEKLKEIYFLSDVPSSYRYGYIIIIKTANKRKSSTTSNVVIKLYGENSDSKEHVLNYPDPDKRMLQRNREDWFFLATSYYLGDIQKIELWFDSIGYRPAWHCAEIEILDLQLQKYWEFRINFRFEIDDYTNYIFVGTPLVNQNSNKYKNMIQKLPTALHGCHFWNLCCKDSELSEITRLSIMLSIFLTNFAVQLFLYGVPGFVISDCLREFLYYGFYNKMIWITIIGLIATFCSHYPIVYYMRISILEYEDIKRRKKISKICWSLLIFLIITSIALTLTFGFWVPYVTSLLWLTSSLSTIIIYVFLIENLVLIYKNLFANKETRIKYIITTFNSVLSYIQNQREKLYESFGKYAMRPYFKHLYKPLDFDQIKEISYWAGLKKCLFNIFEDILMISMYIILLYIIILYDKDPMAIKSNEEIKDLIKGLHSRTFSEYLSDRKQIGNYIENTLIHSLQSLHWYGECLSKDPGMTIDRSNKYIGIARIRQHRSENSSCHVNSEMTFIQTSCTSQFATGPQTRSFSENWGSVADADNFFRMSSAWIYNGSGVSDGYFGKFSSYPSGGYIASLGRTHQNSLVNFRYLTRYNWIDQFTRCLFIEFLTYSANSNIFNSVMVILEISLTGLVRREFNVYSSKLLLVGGNNTLIWIIFLAFLLILVILTLRLILKTIELKKLVFKDVWRLIDIFIIILSLISIFLYLQRSYRVGEFLDQIAVAKHNKFVNYFHLFDAEFILSTVAALLVFLATFRLWKLLRFLVIIKVVEKTLYLTMIPLLCLGFCHYYLVLAYALSGFMFFGDRSLDFSNTYHSYMNLVMKSIGFYTFDLDTFDSFTHYVYYISYTLLTLLVITLYVVIIVMNYSEAQKIYSNVDEYNLWSFIKENYEYYLEVCKVMFKKNRLKGGEDNGVDLKKIVYPKADEHRFAKCLTVEKYKMDSMRQISLNVIRNQYKQRNLSEDDVKLINQTVACFFKVVEDKEDKEVFFLSNVQGQKTKLIDDQTFVKMENILNALCSERKTSLYERVMEDRNMQLDRILSSIDVVTDGLKCIKV